MKVKYTIGTKGTNASFNLAKYRNCRPQKGSFGDISSTNGLIYLARRKVYGA
jgi:hypothetical protein